MQIVDIKNNLIKITYAPVSEPLSLGSFVTVQDDVQMFIAQVISLDAKPDNHFSILKMLFTLNKDGGFSPYSGTIPSIDANVQILSIQQLVNVIEAVNPICIGEITEDKLPFKLDLSLLREKTLVCVENQDEQERFISTIWTQIVNYGCKVVIFDTTGTTHLPSKLVAGENFKLPLNYDTINFIYEKGLTDASGETKAMIQEIFLEVQNYVKQIPEKFIPFEMFKSVVDEQYEELKHNELVLLKNKLLKYYDGGVFAQDKKDFENLKKVLKTLPICVIDISKFDGTLQREFISYTYSVMKDIGTEFYSIIPIEDDNTDKKLLKQIFVSENIFSLILSPYKYKYLKEIKQLSKNLILFTPIQQQDDFAGYNVFLSKLNHGEFIVYGDKTQYIPFIVSLTESEKVPRPQKLEQYDIATDIQNGKIPSADSTEDTQESLSTEDNQIIEEIENPAVMTEKTEITEETIENIEPQIQKSISDDEIADEIQAQISVEEQPEQNIEVQPDAQEDLDLCYRTKPEEPVEPVVSDTEENNFEVINETATEILPDETEASFETTEPEKITEVLPEEQIAEPQEYEQIEQTEQVSAETQVFEQDEPSEQFEQYEQGEPQEQFEQTEQFEQVEEFEQPVPEQIQPEIDESVNQSIIEDINKMESVPASDLRVNSDLTDEDLDFIEENIGYEQGEPQEQFEQTEQFEQVEEFEQPVHEQIQPKEIMQGEIFEDGEISIPPRHPVAEDDLVQSPHVQLQQVPSQLKDVPPQLQEVPPQIPPQPVAQKEPQEFKETPIVPVYPAEQPDTPKSDGQFAQGDVVMHETYGKGIVTKIISYGEKVLCSIDFEQAGKKLLDPAVTQLQKM
ncbi:hypothetical protein IJ732_00470 [bacterium]|nr:hypothetical protein [bacterium]